MAEAIDKIQATDYMVGENHPTLSDTLNQAADFIWARIGCSGLIMMYGGATAPTGWLLCDGSAVSRTTYADLFAIIGTTYGIGDGSTTFNVPDMRSRSPVGAGQGAGLTNRNRGDTGGEETHVLTIAELADHTHTVNTRAAIPASSVTGTPGFWQNTTGVATGGAGSDTAHNTMHPFAVVNFIIKY